MKTERTLSTSRIPSRRPEMAMTLIELLVVMIIIAVLAAIIVPVTMKARETAKLTKCQNNLKQVWTAMNLYATDYNEYINWAPDGGFVCQGDQLTYYWYELLTSYTEGIEVFQCPGVREPKIGTGCPLTVRPNEYIASYTSNEFLTRATMSRVRFPDSTIFAWDCMEPGMSRGYVINPDLAKDPPETAPGTFADGGPDWGQGGGGEGQAPENSHFGGHWLTIHKGGNSYVFMDGHVDWFASEVAGRDWHFASLGRHWDVTRGGLK